MDVLTALQNSGFKTIDFVILVIYLIVLVSLGLFLSRNKDGKEKSANDYFLAGNTLTWWAVGASLIAANISAEQFIGMSGTGFRDGIAIAAYEVMAAITLVVIGKFLLPVMLDRKIFTIPQFLRERYNDGVGLAFSILWLFLYVFVNLTSVAWLGALADTVRRSFVTVSDVDAEFSRVRQDREQKPVVALLVPGLPRVE